MKNEYPIFPPKKEVLSFWTRFDKELYRRRQRAELWAADYYSGQEPKQERISLFRKLTKITKNLIK